MARILLGWELGAGNGHTSRLLDLASILAERGHQPLCAPQQIGPFAAHWPTWQAPVWPRLLEALYRRYPRNPSTMSDALAYLGLDDPQAVTAMILAWDRLLADLKPDAVIAEYAPMLQVAARGRVPTLAYGTGFTLPPADLPQFPSLFGDPPVVPEPALLDSFNGALAKAGRAAFDTLPQLFAGDSILVSTFAELDPYRQWRTGAVKAPTIIGAVPLATDRGEEVFVYFNGRSKRPNAFWQGLANSGLRIRVYDPQLSATDIATLERAGMIVARQPIPFAVIVERSRLLISHGGLGFVSSGLLAGLPQMIFPFDAEKRLTAIAIDGKAGCRHLAFQDLDADRFATLLRESWSDETLRTQARNAAPAYRDRMSKLAGIEAADMVEALL